VDAAVRADNVANLANLQTIRRLLEWLLHLAVPEPTEVPALVMRGAVRMLPREFAKLIGGSPDLSLIASEDLDGSVLRARDVALWASNEDRERD
jgi:hypothetical protein